MTRSKISEDARRHFEGLPAEDRRRILEGAPTRIHVFRISVVWDGDGFAFAGDTLHQDGRSVEWERTTQQIARIAMQEVKRLDRRTMQALALLPAVTLEEAPAILLETWVSMADDGGSLWTVTSAVSLYAAGLPAVTRAAERARRRVLKVVCAL